MELKILTKGMSFYKNPKEQEEFVKNLTKEEIEQLGEELKYVVDKITKPIIELWENIKPIIIKICEDYKGLKETKD